MHYIDASDKFNTAFYASDGSTFIVTVDKRIDPEIKKKLSALDGADAYNAFIDVYGSFLDNPKLRSSADGVTQGNRNKKNKKNFLSSLTEVKSHNRDMFENGNSKYELTMNTFSVMDQWEKSQYLGAGNISNVGDREQPDGLTACRNRKTSTECLTAKLNHQCDDEELAEQCEMTCGRCGEFKLPETLDWNARGYVTPVKDQLTCGSCWTFSAVGVLEWIYKKTTGKSVQLSEQELLDCVYQAKGDIGCSGGWPHHAWEYVAAHSRLASTTRYPYANSDTDCHIANLKNMNRQFGDEIKGKFRVGRAIILPPNFEELVIEAVNTMVVAVAIFVSKDTNSGFYQIKEDGIWDDCPSGSAPNHAVTLVGYGPDYWEIKNSWGPDWGRNGFGKILRGEGVNMCSILNVVAYAEYTDLDPDNGEPDFPREAVIDEDDDVDCENDPLYNDVGQCPNWAGKDNNFCTEGDYISWMLEHCKKSCKQCGPSCDPGHFIAPGALCTICPRNTHNNDPKALTCTPCSAGSWSLPGSTSSEDCTECQPGTHLDADSNRCTTCPADTYSSYGATACTECPEGSRSVAGSLDDSDCMVPPEDCVDALSQTKCQEFREEGGCVGGEHITTAKWGCRKTCTFCQEIENCENAHGDDAECDDWAGKGYCDEVYADWMADNCRKSCEHCEVGECMDQDDECAQWSALGYCSESSKYHDFMKGHCSKVCGFCTVEADCDYDADQHRFCSSWKEQGYCSSTSFLEFMRTNCATTCQLCPVSTSGEGTVCKADDPTQSCDYYFKLGYCTNQWKSYMETYCSTTCGLQCAGSCSDNNANCASWAGSGQCSSNPYYMNVNCKSSCNKCYENSVSKVRGVPGCQDKNEYCSAWEAQGYCSSNSGWMAGNCALSCNTCRKKGNCGDIGGSNCEDWAANGECERNPGNMLVNCKASCNACDDDGGVESSGSRQKGNCGDIGGSACAGWAASGECQRNPAYMLVSCKGSCNACDDGGAQSSGSSQSSTCSDTDNRCPTWASQGYCYHYKSYCRRSCRLC